MTELAKQYSPFDVEAKWQKHWVDTPYTADALSDKPPFCIVIPPPNVTGSLHLGHAFDNTLIDTLIRYKRMQGFETLFQPGTDHAGISTQVLVERALAKEGLNKYDLGRDAFLERVWEWKETYGGIILEQLQRLGVSADWSRIRFTMDEGLSKAVRHQFIALYHQGKIYRGERIVNWDPESQTVLSELEVDREERQGHLYTLRYELQEGEGEICIATVRPETIFADQAVAVHPEDTRYQHLIGQQVRIPLTSRYVPIIADEAVEIDFGTGALKITPAHDPLDFEIGERHQLARPSVIDKTAKLTSELVPEAFQGLDRFEARDPIVKALEDEGTLVAVKKHTVSLGLSQRTKAPVEPMVSLQWFYKMAEDAPAVLAGLDEGEMRLFPERYEKVSRAWLTSLKDWCISRQLWWGHQIPAWYDPEGNIYVPSLDNPSLDCPDDPQYADKALTQDPDVFDTWFGSNLWPFSTMGWPNETDPFFKKFYPTSVMVTGYDILFFWVTKMQLAGYGLVGQKPFTDILLHGLVLDEHGQKMSKSKGTGIDPLEVIDQYGADALRFAMTYVSTHGQDIRWDNRRVEMGRNFNNKLWNATRFALMNLSEGDIDPGPPVRLADRWILSRLQRATKDVTEHLNAYDLGLANRALYEFVWSEFCDWYLEAAKPALREGDGRTRYVLKQVLSDIVKLLHPILPFITAELYQALGESGDVGYAAYPQADERYLDTSAEFVFERLQQMVSNARTLRANADLPPNQVLTFHLSGTLLTQLATGDIDPFADDSPFIHLRQSHVRPTPEDFKALKEGFEFLGKAHMTIAPPPKNALCVELPHLTIGLPFEGQVDVAKWRERQQTRLAKLKKQQASSEKKLSNTRFVEGAPPDVVAEERLRLEESTRLIGGLLQTLAQLSDS